MVSEIKIVGQGMDTLVLNICYTDEDFQPVKRELDEGLQRELNQLQNTVRLREAPVPTRWTFRLGLFFRFIYDKF
jgi:hypothetical protein